MAGLDNYDAAGSQTDEQIESQTASDAGATSATGAASAASASGTPSAFSSLSTFTLPDGAGSEFAPVTLSAADAIAAGTPVIIPGGAWFLQGDFVREGSDLIITGPDGQHVVIEGYFDADYPLAIATDTGVTLDGLVVARLAGPVLPGDFASSGELDFLAQASEPIGTVETLEGTVEVTRADGTQALLATGDPVYQGDIVETASGGSVGVVFVDESTFSLGEEGQITLDEMIYSAEDQTGSAALTLLQGTFSFVSGAIAKTDPDAAIIDTPTGTIGIRGTGGGGSISASGELTVAILEETGEITGEITVTNDNGVTIINEPSTGVYVAPGAAPSAPITFTPAQLGQVFGPALSSLPNVDTAFPSDVIEGAEAGVAEAQAATQQAAEAEAAAEEAQAAAEEAQAAADEAQAEAEALADAGASAEAQAAAEAAAAEAQAEAAALEAAAAAAEAEAAEANLAAARTTGAGAVAEAAAALGITTSGAAAIDEAEAQVAEAQTQLAEVGAEVGADAPAEDEAATEEQAPVEQATPEQAEPEPAPIIEAIEAPVVEAPVTEAAEEEAPVVLDSILQTFAPAPEAGADAAEDEAPAVIPAEAEADAPAPRAPGDVNDVRTGTVSNLTIDHDGGSAGNTMDVRLEAAAVRSSIDDNNVDVSGLQGDDDIDVVFDGLGNEFGAEGNEVSIQGDAGDDTLGFEYHHLNSAPGTGIPSANFNDNKIWMDGGTGDDTLTFEVNGLAGAPDAQRVELSTNQVYLAGGDGTDTINLTLSDAADDGGNNIVIDGGAGADTFNINMDTDVMITFRYTNREHGGDTITGLDADSNFRFVFDRGNSVENPDGFFGGDATDRGNHVGADDDVFRYGSGTDLTTSMGSVNWYFDTDANTLYYLRDEGDGSPDSRIAIAELPDGVDVTADQIQFTQDNAIATDIGPSSLVIS